MTARTFWLVLALAALLVPSDAAAQGRGRGNRDRERGPAFCRSGEGHPVHGWRWCEERGWGRDRAQYPRAYPDARRNRYPGRDPVQTSPYPRYNDAALNNGYADGYEKGLDDGRDGRAHDPVRHRWYREGDRGYEDRYGSRAQYQNAYRQAFRNGYEAGYRDGQRSNSRDDGVGLPWPF